MKHGQVSMCSATVRDLLGWCGGVCTPLNLPGEGVSVGFCGRYYINF